MQSSSNFSKYIIPISFLIDVILLTIYVDIILPSDFHIIYFKFFLVISWIILSINIDYYKIYRFLKPFSIFEKNLKIFLLLLILCYAFSGFYFNNVKSFRILNYIIYSFATILTLSFLKEYSIRLYRKKFKRNYIDVVLIGKSGNIQKLNDLLVNNVQYGYNVSRYFPYDESTQAEKFNEIFEYCKQHSIKEIYVSLYKISKEQIKNILSLAENDLIEVKFVPENKDLFTYNYKIEYYNYIPIFISKKTSLHDPITALFKRIFDIIFSFFVIIFILSWLIPIMGLIIKIESKGPIFFRQSRPGFGEREFFCYKFRSMRVNITTEKEASRNDPRVTKSGKFIRKTSIDELPQFFNVFLGDMSVVGPRPHLWTQNKVYGKKIERYMARHYVKPGITGLAQVKGYRGEIETDEDMINRINYDVYYIENWSFLLDLKIIFQTVINIFKGEEKAY